MSKATSIVLITSLLFSSMGLLAQSNALGQYMTNKRLDFSQSQVETHQFFINKKKDLGLTNHDEMVELKSWEDMSGMTRYRYKQYHKGMQVIGASYTLHTDGRYVKHATGNLFPNIDINDKPSFDKNFAGKQAIDATKRKLEAEEIIEPSEQVHWEQSYEGLVIIDSSYPEISGTCRLAYSYLVESDNYEIPIKYIVYIDAHTGRKITELNQIKCGSVKGIAKTRYYGDQEITTDSIAPNLYLMRDNTRGDGIVTIDFDANAAEPASDSDNIWEHSHDSEFERNATADAHYCTTKYYDMMQEFFEWDGLDGEGGELISNVNVFGRYFVNAFWNGTATNYGNGNCEDYGPLTSMTIVGHEFGHGWTQATSDLIYQDESGALNESISDILGKGLEYYADRENFTWNIGDRIRLNEDALIIRSMSDPNVRNDPKFYNGRRWFDGAGDNGGVHSNSGVLNHWFYLLVEGVSDVNQVGYEYNVESIGMRNALDIIFIAQTAYLTENSGYIDCMYSTIQVARDLYGEGTPELASVVEAWRAVGLYEGIDNFDLSISLLEPSFIVCSGEERFVEVSIKNAGLEPIPGDLDLEVSFLQTLSVKVIEDFRLEEELLPGDSIIHTFSTPVINNVDRDGFFTVELIAADPLQINNSEEGVMFISEVGGIEVSLESFSLFQRCSNGFLNYRLSLKNNGCEVIAPGDDITIEIESDQGSFTLTRQAFSGIRPGSFFGLSGILTEDIPDEITTYSANLIYDGDSDLDNNFVVGEDVMYTEVVKRGYRRDFEDEVAQESYAIDANPIHNINSVMNYKGNNMLAIRGTSALSFTSECEDPEGFFDTHSRKTQMEFCIDGIDMEKPIFSFDLLTLSNEYRRREIINNQFGTMIRVSTSLEDYPVIYTQRDDILRNYTFELPPFYTGSVEIEILTLSSNTDRENILVRNLDVVLFDNFKFYQEGDLSPDYTEEGFVISPNPVDNLLRVKSANLDEPFDVQIFDQMGRLITRKTDNQNIAMINLAEAAQGIYFVTIIKSGEHVSTEKFIKL
jgi:Zn-dependent metalloprotease